MIQTQPLELRDFSGGITDNFIDASIVNCQYSDNLLVTENRKLETRDGSNLLDIDYPQVPVGQQRVGTLINFQETTVVQSGKKFYYDDGTAWAPIVGPNVDPLNTIDVNSSISFDIKDDQLFILSDQYSKLHKIYVDGSSVWQCRTAGVPALASDPSLAGGSGGGNNYIYSFHYYYAYTVGTVSYLDVGSIKQVQILDIDSPDATTVNITSIPVLANGANDNYDTANIKVKIFRTVANGSTSYLIGEVTNGTTIYNDSVADSVILDYDTIYSTGGELSKDVPPLAKYVHIVNGAAFFGNIKEGTEILKTKIMQSVPLDYDSVPVIMYDNIDGEVTGISSYMDRPLFFTKFSVTRADGLFDASGSGNLLLQKINDTIGAISDKSIVQTPYGVVFASKEGFAYTDGFKVFTISNNLTERYRAITATEAISRRIQGVYNRKTNCVYWTAYSNADSTDCDIVFVLDLRWGIDENSTFTTLKFLGANPTAIMFNDDSELIRGDLKGYIFKHGDGLLNDPRIDTLVAPSTWGSNPIIYRYKTVAIRPDAKFRSFIPRMIFASKNDSNLSVQINSDSDIGNRKRSMKPLRWRGNFIWGDPLFVWGRSSFQWGVQGFIEHQRYFYSDDLRCTYKQVELTNAIVEIINSDSLCTVTVDPSSKTLTLDDTVSFDWLDDMDGYSVYLDHDGYTKEFPIVTYGADTVTVLDPQGVLPVGSGIKFTVKGIPKDEVLSLLNLAILYAPLGQTQDRFAPSQLGGNV